MPRPHAAVLAAMRSKYFRRRKFDKPLVMWLVEEHMSVCFKGDFVVFRIWSKSFEMARITQRFGGCDRRAAMPGLYSPLSTAIKNHKQNNSVENRRDSAP